MILKHRNHDEVVDLVRFALDSGLDISFIEEMPLGEIGDHDRAEAYYSSDAIRADLAQVFELIPTTETTGGPARYYRIPDTHSRIGFISPHSHNFCGDCNRVRLTADGRLRTCLYGDHEVNLRDPLRRGEPLAPLFRQALAEKPLAHDLLQLKVGGLRALSQVGG